MIERIAPILKVKQSQGPVIDFGPKVAAAASESPSGEER